MSTGIHAFCQNVMKNFPHKGMRLAFAYGSGVFQQTGHKNMTKNMVDFIFTVEDPAKWHRENIERNKRHYSWLRLAGANYISHVQKDFGANIYFNTLVKCEKRRIKYGVISTDCLIRDLTQWDTLYVSGRLHKPVHVIDMLDKGMQLQAALKKNHMSALHSALLLLPDHFTEEEFYLTIATLSYSGDIRMTIGEDKNKVKNIVLPNIERFREMYGSLLKNDEWVHWRDSNQLEQSLCAKSRLHHMQQLPINVLHGMTAKRNMDGRHRDVEEVIRAYSQSTEYEPILRSSISDIVKRSSLSQTAKGFFTAGFWKSCVYSSEKLTKMVKSSK